MIAGVGVDVVAVSGFRDQLELDATTFTEVFTPAERDLRATGSGDAEHLAARWAAKEAFVKAWAGSRHGRPPQLQSVEMRDIEVVCDAWGRPALRLHGEVDEEFSRAVPDASVHLSISHDGDVAIAYVVIDRVMP